MTPFDQIYWYSAGGKFELIDPENYEAGDAKMSLCGETANIDPTSTFSFAGKRRYQIKKDGTQPTGGGGTAFQSNFSHQQKFNYNSNNVNDMTTADLPAGQQTAANLRDAQNKESLHWLLNLTKAKTLPSFCGIHNSDKISVTATKKYENGAYLVLRRREFQYNDSGIFTTSSSFATANAGTGGGTVLSSLVDNTKYTKDRTYTGAVGIKYISVYRNGTLQRAVTDLPTDLRYLEVDGTGTISTIGTTATISTFGARAQTDYRNHFFNTFKIKISGVEYDINTVNSANLILSGSPGASASAYTILIPRGAPDVNTVFHPNSHSTGATFSLGSGNDVTWGLFPNACNAATSGGIQGNGIFEGNPIADARYLGDGTLFFRDYHNNSAYESPYFSNNFLLNLTTSSSLSWAGVTRLNHPTRQAIGFNPVNELSLELLENSTYTWRQTDNFGGVDIQKHTCIASDKSSALWPAFNKVLRKLTDDSSQGAIENSNDANLSSIINGSVNGEFGAGNNFAALDMPIAILRPTPNTHVLSTNQTDTSQNNVLLQNADNFVTKEYQENFLDGSTMPNNTDITSMSNANKQLVNNRVNELNLYPYLLAYYGYFNLGGDILDDNDKTVPNTVGTTDALADEDPHYLTIWETDSSVNPGTTYEVDLQYDMLTKVVVYNNVYQSPILTNIFNDSTVCADKHSGSRMSIPASEFQLILVAKKVPED